MEGITKDATYQLLTLTAFESKDANITSAGGFLGNFSLTFETLGNSA